MLIQVVVLRKSLQFVKHPFLFCYKLLTQYCAGGKIEKNEMGGACGAYGKGGEVCTGFWLGNLRERHHWGDPDVDGRIILDGSSGSGRGLWRLDGGGSG